MRKHKAVSFILTLCMVLTMIPSVVFAGSSAEAADTKTNQVYADMTGHWAAAAVAKWSGLGIVKGDDRGFRPDDSITRAEMAVILDNLMDYQTKANNTFSDVKSSAWYSDAILKANAAGIITGDGAGHASPSSKVTREQAAVMLARAFGTDEDSGKKTTFKDATSISAWAKPLVFGMESDQYIGGTDGGYFQPKANITRAQVVTIIDNAVKAYYTAAGTYTDNVSPTAGGANCVAIVKTSGVTLKGLKLSGDLIVAEGVGTGDFTLDGATITAKLIARGGGENSIHVINGADVKGKVSVEKVDGVVRIVSDGVVIANLDADSEVILEGAFTNVVVAEGASVEIRGQVTNLDVTAKAEIKLAKDAKVGTLAVAKEAEGTNLNIDKTAELKTLKTEAKMTTSGDGAAKTITGTGTVTDKETGKTEKTAATSGGGGGGGGGNSGDNTGGNAADKRSLNVLEDDKDNATITGSGIRVYFTGTDQSGVSCKGLSLGVLTVKEGETLFSTSDYSVSTKSDSVFFNASCFKSEGKHTLTYNVKTSDGKTFTASSSIYIIPATTTVLYDSPQSGSLKIYQFTGAFGSGTRGAEISSGGSVTLGSNSRIEIQLSGLPADKRVKSVTITKSYYGYTQTDDYTDYFISSDLDMLNVPQGTVTIQVVTEDVPSSLPEISGIEFYLGYDKNSDTYSDPVTTTVPALESPEDSIVPLFAKVLFADGKKSSFANYLWEVETAPGTYSAISTKNYNFMSLYEAGTDKGYRYRVTASGYEKQSQGTASATIYVSEPLHSQGQPTGLTTSSVTAAAAADGKIGNTTTDMEYKLQSAGDSAYVACTAGETTGLAAGIYSVRLKAKLGYSAGYPTTVTINQPQAAPTGLTGLAPATPDGYGKINGTTVLMEYKKSAEPEPYYNCSAGETTSWIITAGTYSVRFKAKTGYDAGAPATISVPAYVNLDQAAPTGLGTVSSTSYSAQNGQITNTTVEMEYKLTSASIYTDCSGTTTYVKGGTYNVRFKAKSGYNAGADATVVVEAPAPKSIATLQSLGYVCTYSGSTEYTEVPGFDPSITSYNVSLYGNEYGKTFNLNPYETDAPFADTTYSAITGDYFVSLKAEVTAEDGVTKKVYTVNITVERRSASASINTGTYTTGATTGPSITLSLTNQDGDSCSFESLNGTVSIKDMYGEVIDPAQYTVDEATGTITITPGYFTGKSANTTCYFHITVTSDGHKIEIPAMYAPHVTIN